MMSAGTPKTKSVTFASHVETTYPVIRNRFDIPLKEWRHTWYKYYELQQLQEEAFAMAEKLEYLLEQEQEQFDEDDEEDDISIILPTFTKAIVRNDDSEHVRGLEPYTRLGKERVWKRRRDAIHAVLHAQQQQQLQQQQLVVDADSIAAVYSEFTSTCAEKARHVGIKDEQWVTTTIHNTKKGNNGNGNGVMVTRPVSIKKTTTTTNMTEQGQQQQQSSSSSSSPPPTILVVGKGGGCDNTKETRSKNASNSTISKLFKLTTRRRKHRRSTSNASISTTATTSSEDDESLNFEEKGKEGKGNTTTNLIMVIPSRRDEQCLQRMLTACSA